MQQRDLEVASCTDGCVSAVSAVVHPSSVTNFVADTTEDTLTPTANDTFLEDEIEYYYFYKTEQLTFLWILFTMIVVTNSAVLIALMLSKNRKSRMNFFIMQLAIADLAVGLINVLTDIIWRTTVAFYAGNVVCKLIKFLQVLVTYSSTYVLVALSIDRYDAITHPMNFSGSWTRAKILVCLSWGLSAIFSIPAIFLNEKAEVKGHTQCWIDLKPIEWQIYITLVAMSLFFVPALIISACYSVIVYTIWNKSKLMAYPKLTRCSTMSKSSTRTTKSNASCVSDPDRKRSSSRGIIPRAKIKTVKMTFVIIFVFILCWSPYFIYDLLQVYGYIPFNQTTIAVSTFIQSLAPLNSAANPIIYCLFSTRTCRNLKRLQPIRWLGEKICFCYSPLSTPLPNSGSKRMSVYTSVTAGTANSKRSAMNSKNPAHLMKNHIVDKERIAKEPNMMAKNTHV